MSRQFGEKIGSDRQPGLGRFSPFVDHSTASTKAGSTLNLARRTPAKNARPKRRFCVLSSRRIRIADLSGLMVDNRNKASPLISCCLQGKALIQHCLWNFREDWYRKTPMSPGMLVDSRIISNALINSGSLKDTDDGLGGFEITDPDGYVLFFGRPR